MKNPKILFLIQLPPPIHGASLMNKSVYDHIRNNNKFEITLIDLRFNKRLDEIEKVTLTKGLSFIKIAFKLLSECISNRFSLAYFSFSPVGIAFYRDLIFVSILKLFRVPIVSHIRVLGINGYPRRKFLYNFAFGNTDVICLSRIAAKDISHVYNGIPIIVNDGLIDPTVAYNLSNKKIYSGKLVFLSNLFISKGVFDIVEICGYLKERGLEFNLKIVGEETAELTIKQLESHIYKKGLESFIEVIGPLHGYDKFECLIAADIFCFPSFYKKENFPGVILEAMSCSLPIVSYIHSSVPEMIKNENEGLLVEVRDKTSFANAVERLMLNSSQRVELANNARKAFEDKFTLKIFENNMLNTFNKLISKSEN